MEPEQIETKIAQLPSNLNLTLENPEVASVHDSPQLTDLASVNTIESSSKISEDPYKIIEEQKNTINSLTLKLNEIQEKLEMLKEEKAILTSEIRDMSGSLIEESYKSIAEINESKDLLKQELKRVKQNESALKVQNTDLRALVEEMNKATRNQSSKQQTSTKTPVVNFGNSKLKSPEKALAPRANSSKTDIFVPEISYTLNETYYREFVEWYEGGCHPDTMFFKSILRDETYPSLSFKNSELQSITRTYMESWNANPTIEKDSSIEDKVCDFTKKKSKDNYMVKFNTERMYIACSYIRLRIISVVELYIYIRYIALGIVKSSIDEMFNEIIRLRVKVSMARLGYFRN